MMPLPFLFLRKITKSDYFICWQLRNDVTVRRWLKPISFRDFIEEVEGEDQHTLVGMVGNEVVGVSHLTILGEKSVSLFLAIQQKERLKTYGKQLCNTTCLWATHSGYEKVIASVDERNVGGMKLLEKCEFKYEGVAPSKGQMKRF